ncbi:MAG: glycosyltransferase family 4 protein [Opitutaceae bacterium]|nr:glycosyltransferase family 4 protein [Opitutaceae bacterium]
MKILLLSPELFLAEGGIARILRLYLKALCEICGPGGRVDTITLNDSPKPDERLGDYGNARLGRSVGCNRSKLKFIRHALALGRTSELLICGHLHQLAVARLARCFNPTLRYLLVAHGIEVWRPYTWLERWALRGAHRILCISEFTRRQLLRFAPALDASRLVVVPNTLDPKFAPAAEPAVTPGREKQPPRILTVGRLTKADTYKGFDTLIEALPLLRTEFPEICLRVVGDGDDINRLKQLARDLGVAGAVHFTGGITDTELRKEYESCDVFALPSRKEGFGLVYLEAMIHGKPCVGARAGGVPEVINDSVGALADYGNIPALAAAIADVIRRPRDSGVVRLHAGSFAFPAFKQRLAAVLTA